METIGGAGFAGADDDQAEHVDAVLIDVLKRGDPHLFAVATEVLGDDDRGGQRSGTAEDGEGAGETPAASAGGGVVEGKDEITGGGGLQALLDDRPGCEQIRERDGAKVVTERGAGAGGCGLQRRNAGGDDHLDALPGGIFLAIQELEREGSHGIDAGIAGADQRHPPAVCGKVQRHPRAVFLLAQLGAVDLCGRGKALLTQEIEIALIADPVLGGLEQMIGLRGAPSGGPRTDADDRKLPLRPAQLRRVDHIDRAGDGAGGAGGFGFFHDQGATGAGGFERSALGHPVTAGLVEDEIGRVGEAIFLAFQGIGSEKTCRYAEMLGERMDGRFCRFQLDRDDSSDRGFGEAMPLDGRFDQLDQFGGVDIALAADAKRQRGWVVDERLSGGGGISVRHQDFTSAAFGENRLGPVQPVGAAEEGDGIAGEEGGGDGFDRFGVGDGPAGRRLVEGQTEAKIARGGDGCFDAKGFAELARKLVGAAMAAEQRHDGAAVFGDGENRGLAGFVGEDGGEEADRDGG